MDGGDERIEFGGKDGVGRASGSPYGIEAFEGVIDEGIDLGWPADGRYATDGVATVFEHLFRGAHLDALAAHAEDRGEEGRIDLAVAGGEDHGWAAFGHEEERFDDLAKFAADSVCRFLGGVCAGFEGGDLAGEAEGFEGRLDTLLRGHGA